MTRRNTINWPLHDLWGTLARQADDPTVIGPYAFAALVGPWMSSEHVSYAPGLGFDVSVLRICWENIDTNWNPPANERTAP